MNSLSALAVATFVLVLVPGPNVALIVANSLQSGFRAGAVTVLGTTAGVAFQLLLLVGGLAAMVEVAAETLSVIRWAGVVYLIWLGVRTWRTPAEDLAAVNAAPAAFWRGCLIAAANPKTLLFNAAFIPQFAGDGSFAGFGIAAAVFLTVLFAGDLLWVVFANSARRAFGSYSSWRNRITGAFLALAGLGLAAANRS